VEKGGLCTVTAAGDWSALTLTSTVTAPHPIPDVHSKATTKKKQRLINHLLSAIQ